ncbi:efflux RND transporter permease subunit [Halorientalis marina]|uniref:efflux RND transporter permease subunit n=1 Tax=Halorientalis marina TaxID=2931976 RepID=UPI001FF65CA6|nr:MMPL family transporter [Halorientalis marina]
MGARAIEWVDDRIAAHPGKVALVFLALTVVFVGGLGTLDSESGSSQFTADLESAEAMEEINREFGASFGGDPTTASTILHDGGNVLAKPALVRSLRAQERLAAHDDLRVTGTTSAAGVVATRLDPSAATLEAKRRAVERATPSEIDAAVREAAAADAFGTTVSEDVNAESATASAAKTTVTHGVGELSDRERRVQAVVDTVPGEMRVLGDSPNTMADSLLLVVPAALVLIVAFLIVAFRDPFDLCLGVLSLVMAILWTFGATGLVGIPFNMLMVALVPLLIAVGVDFGIHSINRYREERVDGRGIVPSMRTTTDQLLVAFFIVTGTTVIGFLSNLASALEPIRDFGVVAAIGIVATFLVFGIFLPAAKVYLDGVRERYPIPAFGRTPLGADESALSRVLSSGAVVANRAPALLLAVMIVATLGAGVYATGIGTGFSTDDFQPAEETPDALQTLPEPFAPPESYPYVRDTNFRDRHFESSGRVMMYVRGQLDEDHALAAIHAAGRDPPGAVERDGRQAEARSIVSVIESRAAADSEFRALVARNDADDDGIPDDNLDEVYDALLSSPARDRALQYVDADRGSAKVAYTVDGDADPSTVAADGAELAAEYPYPATATGGKIIWNEASTLIMQTVVQSLAITLVGAALFLVVVYWVLEDSPTLGLANVVPIAMTVTFVVATMRYVGVTFNVFNAMILSLTIGLGIDYSVHVTHRFADELERRPLSEALVRATRGTGGALTGSLLTTVGGVGVLVLAVNPAIGVFGLLTMLSVCYAYLTSVFVLPSVLVVQHRVASWWQAETGDLLADRPAVTPGDD